KLGLQTDSSYRFERGVDFETVEKSSEYAVKLINEISCGIEKYKILSHTTENFTRSKKLFTEGKFSCGQEVLLKSSGIIKKKNRIIELVFDNIKKVLGIEIKKEQIVNILQALGFKIISRSAKSFKIGIPCYRQDVKQPVDLIEELARIFGYENIPVSLPRLNPQIIDSGTKVSIPGIKNILQGLGLSEIVTYSLIDRKLLAGWEKLYPQPLEILNPLSREQEILRPVIIPSMIKCLAYNLNQKQTAVKFFEIAKIYSLSSNGLPKEDLVLGIVLCGEESFLFEQGAVKEQIGILYLKGVLETLFGRLGVSDYKFTLKGEYFAIFIGGKKAGVMQKIQKTVLDNFDISNKDVFAAEIFLETILTFARPKIKYSPLPKYPGISRDISLVVKENINLQEMLSLIKDRAGDLLFEVKITDYYKGKQIPQGQRGLTISCLYLCEDRTLTDAEINVIHSAACEILTSKFDAKIR
ncbi:MAG: phenylalanine--tRNA ligase subunit beta, partial [Candidatus Omnitrophota bacterium]